MQQKRIEVDDRQMQISWRYNWLEQSSISWRVQKSCRCSSSDRATDSKVVMSISRRHFIVTNEWSSLGQAVQREDIWRSTTRQCSLPDDTIDLRTIECHGAFKRSVNAILDETIDSNSHVEWLSLKRVVQREDIWKSIARRMQSFDDTNDSKSTQFMILTRPAYCKYNFFDEATDSKTVMFASRSHVATLCCLLSRVYDAWRAESCQKHLQKLLPDLTERWVFWTR